MFGSAGNTEREAGVEEREGRLGMREAEVEERMGEVAVGEEALRKDRSVLKGRLMELKERRARSPGGSCNKARVITEVTETGLVLYPSTDAPGFVLPRPWGSLGHHLSASFAHFVLRVGPLWCSGPW